MIYASVNGLRLILVESVVLAVAFGVTYFALRPLLVRTPSPRFIRWLLAREWRGAMAVTVLALALRAMLLPVAGVPQARVNDEYSYLLMADTFAHHRLANPTPPAWQHFETFHVNLRPTYHSKYPVGQGLALAFGQIAFHQPWVGVYLTSALMCGAICWALQAFVSPGWAIVGGVLAVLRIALFSYWVNSYWGGAVAAIGGAIALGAVVRLFDAERSNRARGWLSCAFGIGLLLLAVSRPYEGLAFSVPLLVYFGVKLWRARGSRQIVVLTLVPLFAMGVASAAGMGLYNHATTGNSLEMPYALNYRTYWPLPYFLWQQPNSQLEMTDPVFAKFYEVTAEEYGYRQTHSFAGLVGLAGARAGADWFFYIGPALTFPVLLGVFAAFPDRRLRLVLIAVVLMTFAMAFCVYSLPHYAAPGTVAVYLFAVVGLKYLWRQGQRGEQAFAIAVVATVIVTSLARQTGSAAVNSVFQFPDQRAAITQRLSAIPGKHLVLVSYDLDRHYPGNELVHNGAEFSDRKILWARAKGTGKDLDLCNAYPDRKFWTVTTDDEHFSLQASDLCGTR